MNDETLTALKGSIAKWDAIADGTGADKGVDNCPLCALFYDHDCDGCPVLEKTEYEDCQGSPYEQWQHDYRSEHGVYPTGKDNGAYATTDELKAVARAEADFLRSLLPDGETT